jgi:hypothetical protein
LSTASSIATSRPVDLDVVVATSCGEARVALPERAQRLVEDRLRAAAHAQQVPAQSLEHAVEGPAHP